MKNQTPENQNYKIAIEISNKFEFYFIALVFTILGLSIQTSSLNKIFFQYIFELAAWGFLLTSGLAGLSRLEWMSIFYRHHGELQEEQRILDMLDQGTKGRPIFKSLGESWTLGALKEEKARVEERVTLRKREIEKVNKWTLWKYKIQKWSFVVGLIALIISRGIGGLNTLFNF